MEKIIYFDIAALILLAILMLSTVIRRMTKGISNHMFIFVLLTMLASTVFDIMAVQLDNMGGAPKPLLIVAHTGYLLTHNLTPPAYVLYVISLTDIWHKLRKSRLQQCLLTIPYLALVVLLTVNVFTGIVFTVDNSVYAHSGLFWFLYAVAAYYTTLGLVYLFYYRKLFSTLKLVALASIVPFMVLAVVLHIIFPNFVVEMFATSMSLMLVSTTVQRPEDMIDTFTGLRKYSAYADDIKRSFAIDKHFTIIMLNIDGFVSFQSTISFDEAAELLSSIADCMDKLDYEVGGHSESYYLDRGRFRMVFSGKYRDIAKQAAYMLHDRINEILSRDNLALSLTPYICVTECPEDAGSFKSLMSFGSDFYQKTPDPEGVIMASELFKQEKFDMLNSIDRIIDRALKNNSFKVYYQPIYSVENNRFSSAEALLRLIDEEYGFVPPDLFIPAAEKSGAIHKIGDFVFDEVCRFLASDEFKELGVDYIEINLSVAQCMHSDLADKVLETLNKYGLPSDKINLEITETAVSYGHNVMQNNLDKLSEAGVSFSLDDYGTGYSNMKRVIQLPLKIVKLDKSFVDEQDNPKMWIVLQNTIKMLKDMNMEIVVEGIETQNMVNRFAALNCDFIQGYYYSKPIPREDFVSFIRSAHNIAEM